MSTRREALALGGFAAAFALLPKMSFAQSDYPTRPVELIIPFAPGGGLDLSGRTVARVLTEEGIFPQRIQITNMPGAGGALGMAEMVERDDDAYSLCSLALHVHLTPLLQGTAHSYKDMTSLARLYTEYSMMVVRADSPFQNVQQVADAIAEDVASVSFASATIGGQGHLTACKLAQAAGVSPIEITYVAYSGGEANAALLGGHVDVAIGEADLLGLIESGQMRVLAVASPYRLKGRMKDFPTFREQGFDVESLAWRGLFAPPRMPAEVVAYWHDALSQMVQTDAWKAELEKNQWDDTFQFGDEFRAFLDVQHEDYRTTLQTIGLLKT